MGKIVNPNITSFSMDIDDNNYVDKSMLLSVLNENVSRKSRFICVSRPRRFGKSMAADMIAAYYSKSCDSRAAFSHLAFSSDDSFEKYLNAFNVIKIDMNGMYSNRMEGRSAVKELNAKAAAEMKTEFPEAGISEEDNLPNAIYKANLKTGAMFAVIIDEYDVLIREKVSDAELSEYITFLNGMFKDSLTSSCIVLAYITGILPIVKDKVQSKLNNFTEYTMLDPDSLTPYFGFTAEEVELLCKRNGMEFEEAKRWYDGYNLNGTEIYSPKSVVTAMEKKRYGDYWSKTGSFEVLSDYISMNYDGLKDSVISMIAGETVELSTSAFSNSLNDLTSRNNILTFLIHLGYLSYETIEEDGEVKEYCRIPNKEIAKEWENAISNEEEYAEEMKLVRASSALLNATLEGDEEKVAAAIERSHMLLTDALTYNDEAEMKCVIRFSYIHARNQYTIIPELPAGKGFADIAFIPFVPDKPALIVELKKDKTTGTAIDQIHERNYPAALEKYKGNLLLVAISYDSKTKKHNCIIEKA